MPRRHKEEEEYEEEEEEEEVEEEEEEEEAEEEEEENEEEEDAEEPEGSGEEGEEEEEEEDWAYSTCTGKKKALLIGINYFGTTGELRGCINDVENLLTFIEEQWDYHDADVRVLRDDSEDPDDQPTKANILAAMEWLVEDAQPNDALFLHYSGHGSQQEDEDGDEKDGIDEALCPVDYTDSGLIVDDVLHDILVKPLPRGCRLTVLFDSCHSGSALDLPYMYGADGELIETSAAEDSKNALLAAMEAHNSGDMQALMRSARNMALVASGRAAAAHLKSKDEKFSPADVIFLSGCKDHQTSADAIEDGEATGAVSHALVKTLTENPKQTYKELLSNIRTILQEKYTQIPQLSSSHLIDTRLEFII
ncbi:hypothetical protein EST38_g8300 [Candolleomyces aberdarensis]|uniref:Peptidase C14 caspase domain-containing protein n=1 Tax=Candolleomyces aberdarensis TaxID=2316362 RepID=A0A4Q2DCZ8_9AGAR|nr:hypothetical protein EST38_g8300 [Candolleomyces aberdarensis]